MVDIINDDYVGSEKESEMHETPQDVVNDGVEGTPQDELPEEDAEGDEIRFEIWWSTLYIILLIFDSVKISLYSIHLAFL